MLTTNTSGVKGVYFNKLARKWQAHIKVNGVRVHLGMYSDLGAAAQAYAAASERYHGEFGLIAYKAPTETPETARQSALGVFG